MDTLLRERCNSTAKCFRSTIFKPPSCFNEPIIKLSAQAAESGQRTFLISGNENYFKQTLLKYEKPDLFSRYANNFKL